MVKGGATIIKYLLFVFNFIFVVTGLILIIVGAVVQSKAKNYLDFVGHAYISTAVLMIILGLVVFGIAFLGCCGAVKENLCMIKTFAVFLFILFIMELAGGIAAYVYREKLDGLIKDSVSETFKNAENSSDSIVMKGWDDIQSEFGCCGVEDMNSTYPDDQTIGKFSSCCKGYDFSGAGDKNCTKSIAKEVGLKGCVPVLVNAFRNNIAMIGGAGVGVAFVEVIGIVFSLCLARAVAKDYEFV